MIEATPYSSMLTDGKVGRMVTVEIVAGAHKNCSPAVADLVIQHLAQKLLRPTGEELAERIAKGFTSHPRLSRFASDLSTPGIRLVIIDTMFLYLSLPAELRRGTARLVNRFPDPANR